MRGGRSKNLVTPFNVRHRPQVNLGRACGFYGERGPIPSGPGIGRDLPPFYSKGGAGDGGRMGCICIVIQPCRMKVVTAFENFTAEIIDHHTTRLRLSFARRVSVATYVKGGKCPDHKSTADSNPFRPGSIFTKRELRSFYPGAFHGDDRLFRNFREISS